MDNLNAKICSSIFMKCDVRVTRRSFLGRSMEPPLYIVVIMACLRFLLYSLKLYAEVGEGELESYCIV